MPQFGGAYYHLKYEIESFRNTELIAFLADKDVEGIVAAVDGVIEGQKIAGAAKNFKILDASVVEAMNQTEVTSYIEDCPSGISIDQERTHEASRIRHEVDLKVGIAMSREMKQFSQKVGPMMKSIPEIFGNVITPTVGILVADQQLLEDPDYDEVLGTYQNEIFIGQKPKAVPLSTEATVTSVVDFNFIP